MTPNALARQLFARYERFKLDYLSPDRCRHETIVQELDGLVRKSRGMLTVGELGTSLGGRSINLLRCGTGNKRVLLWSQMHGDESTATLALCDMLNFLVETGRERTWVSQMLEQTSIAIIPMLNPDGADAVSRHTATHVDVNRDARALITAEGRILRETHHALRPAFAFNLHDQSLSSVGASRKVAAMALLAPPADEQRRRPLSRVKAMRICALIAQSLHQFIDGHLATYDDAYEARAFGDRMQSWGTSTILIEAGHWPGDPLKQFPRKLNFVALLVALRSIGDGTYQDVELEHYSRLQPNGKQIYDVIVRNVQLLHPSGWTSRADVALSLEPEANRRSPAPVAVIKEVGDLSTHAGLETIDASARQVHFGALGIEKQIPLQEFLDLLQLHRG